jgi:demethylmenaquinone methyltransferase / 2-methoxy-6-polyprenyl-1,4-benzoquinol methylase
LSGLGHRYWREVIEVLRTIIPVYDRVNSAISLGKDTKFRRQGLRGRVFSGDIILDAGSGYGNMSRLALKEVKSAAGIILYDPISEMLANVNKFLEPGLNMYLSSGVFEYMPFRNNSFDVVMCGYSLRDAIELKRAIEEIHRVLKQGGRLIIVDIGKPDNAIPRAFVSFYLKYLLGILAFVAAGKAGLKFKTLYGTYLRWPHNSDLCSLLAERFSKIELKRALLGVAIIIAAHK